MKIKLKKLYSSPEIFKPIEFIDGINLIMGEKVDNIDIEKGNKTNGVGKSLCIDFINFCLLKNFSNTRIKKIPESKIPLDTNIILDFEINENIITIKRNKKNPENPIIIYKGNENEYLNLNDANDFLGTILFSDLSNFNNLSFREFLGPFMREEESEFKDIISCYDLTKRIPPNIKPHSFIFNIDLDTISRIKEIYKDINDKSIHKTEINKSLMVNGNKIKDIKIKLNSLSDDLNKINLALDSIKSNEAFDLIEKELIDLQSQIDDLRTRKSSIFYQLKKIESFPSGELINNKEIEIIYNHFKIGLGDLVGKSLTEVMEFKNKIDDFQTKLFNEEINTLKQEGVKISEELDILQNQYNTKIKLIDTKGVLKDIKGGYAIYNDKKKEYSDILEKYSDFEKTEIFLKKIKLEKDNLFIKLDEIIISIKDVIDDFNKTILEIHEYIMDNNKASFDIKTINKGKDKSILDFDMRIDDDGSHSIDRTKVFIYDLALLFNKFTKLRHPKFLIHDNIFDVDQDTLIKSLNFLNQKESRDFQYILTLNRDKIENEEKGSLLNLDIDIHRIANFTKQDRFLYGEGYSEV